MRNVAIGILVPLCAAALLSGCKEDKYRLRFSHNLHVAGNGIDCADCHGKPGQPFKPVGHATCADCHEQVAAKEIKPETCGYCHEEKSLPQLQPQAPEPSLFRKSVFVHTAALAGKCQDCHQKLMDKALASVPRLKRDDIVAIRNKAHASGQDCATCHVDMDRGTPPPSHDINWTKRHGVFGRQGDAACSVCHTEDSCKQCHNIMQPASHNNLWRLHSHGAVADWDRESCRTCHEEDSCRTCHAQTRPRTHTARWGAPGLKPSHCIGCHDTSVPGDGCATCHEGGNDVRLHEKYWGGAPINHNQPGIIGNCYYCHWTKTP